MSRKSVWLTLGEAPPLEQPEHRCHRDIFGGSKPAGETQTNTTSTPWAGVQPYLEDIFGRGRALAYGGSPVAPQSPETLQAQQLQAQRAQTGSPLTTAAQTQNLDTSSGKYLDPNSNPFIKSTMSDAMDMAKSKINAQFSGDNYGNSAHQEWLGRGITAAGLPFAANNYEAERGRQMQAGALAPSLAGQDYNDIGLLGQVGQAKDTRSQMVTDRPWENLFNYQKAIAGTPAPGGSAAATQPYFTNPTANAAGTALSAYALYSMFSDRRLKRDIELVDIHPIGVGVYRYRYLWDDVERYGVMADEVEKVRPWAVGEVGGFKTVNYGMLQ